MHSRLAKRVLGALVSAAVMVSMIPAMALAEGEEIEEVRFTFSNSPVYSGETRTSNGIILAPVGGQVGNNSYFGVDEYGTDPETGDSLDPISDDDIYGEGKFTFSIDPNGPYANGKIVGVDIVIPADTSWRTSINNIALESGEGWTGFAANSTFSWSGEAESTSFTMVATEGDGHFFAYSSITVYVVVPVNTITISAGEGVPAYLYKGDTDYALTATVLPDNTTYDIDNLAWSTEDTEIITVTPSNDSSTAATVTGLAYGTATVTATLGGVTGEFPLTVYEHVDGATITAPEGPYYKGYTYGLTVAPANESKVHEGDWEVTSWSSGDTDIATVTKADDGSGQVLAKKDGTVIITAVITDTVTGVTHEATFSMKIEAVATVLIYRMYNSATSEHLYTANVGERDSLINNGWTFEGPAWIAPETSNTPVIRLYNPNAEGGDHVYSSNEGEIATLEAAGWRNEGTAFYSDDFERMTVYRVYDSGSTERNHHYSVDQGEIDWLVGLGYTNEGPALYGIGLYNEAT
jgi:hypothetical protein